MSNLLKKSKGKKLTNWKWWKEDPAGSHPPFSAYLKREIHDIKMAQGYNIKIQKVFLWVQIQGRQVKSWSCYTAILVACGRWTSGVCGALQQTLGNSTEILPIKWCSLSCLMAWDNDRNAIKSQWTPSRAGLYSTDQVERHREPCLLALLQWGRRDHKQDILLPTLLIWPH